MSLAALLLALTGAPPRQTAIEAERAFAADALKHGQWTAFRKWSTEDAWMFTPQPVRAAEFLKDRADPPASVVWWPGKSFMSCDGDTAVNTGPWVREGGKRVGYFTTVWQRQPDGGWKWSHDHGDQTATLRAEGGDIAPVTADCRTRPTPHRARPVFRRPSIFGGESSDGTLWWTLIVQGNGARRFTADLWTAKGWTTVVDDRVAAEPVAKK